MSKSDTLGDGAAAEVSKTPSVLKDRCTINYRMSFRTQHRALLHKLVLSHKTIK